MANEKKEPEVQQPAANEPYPTGNPPDPMEEYWKAHPERKLEADRAAAEEAKAKAKAPAKPEKEDEDTDYSYRTGKGKK